jgi:hypothetical protein
MRQKLPKDFISTYRAEYCAWVNMKHRCYTTTHKAYCNYGARGIIVCDAWLNDVVQFVDDMGPRPGKGYSLDRIDNNGNYEPSNCRWTIRTEQQWNRRVTRMITAHGRTQNIKEWSEETGLKMNTIRWRIKMKLSPEEIVGPVKSASNPNRDVKTGRFI